MENKTTKPGVVNMVASLDAAHVALMGAAEMAARRYGVGTPMAVQLTGAAAMISSDWIPTVIKEPWDGQR